MTNDTLQKYEKYNNVMTLYDFSTNNETLNEQNGQITHANDRSLQPQGK